MDRSSSSAGSSRPSGSRFHGNLSLTNEEWDALHRPLTEPPQLPMTNIEDLEIQTTDIPTAPSSSVPISQETTSKAKASEAWIYFDKIEVDGVRKAKCKQCSKIYSFPKGSGTGPLMRHARSKHPVQQPRQTQISTLGSTLGTFSYNPNTSKSNLAKFLIQSKQPFSFAENNVFTNYIRNTHNPNYEPVTINTIRSEMFRIVEEQK